MSDRQELERILKKGRSIKTVIPILIAAVAVFGLPALYFAVRSGEFRTFLADAFFVRTGAARPNLG